MKTALNVLKILFIVLLVAVLVALVALPFFLRSPKTGALEDLGVSARKALFTRTDEELAADDYLETYLEGCRSMKSVLSAEDFDLPEGLTSPDVRQPFGLFIFDGEKNVPYATEGVFDESKKTLFYAHGMGGNGAWQNCKGFYDAGYNVLNFYWGSFADEETSYFAALCNKVWFRGEKRYHTADGKGWTTEGSPDYAVAEIYAAYYLDLMARHPNYVDKEVVVSGHSYGGMLTSALLSYLTTAFGKGLVDARVLPDRVLLCDPFFINGDEDGSCAWLGGIRPPRAGGTIYFSKQAFIAANKLGIAVTLFRTSGLITSAFFLAYPTLAEGLAAIADFNKEVFYVEANALDIPGFGPDAAHNYGRFWPTQQLYEIYDADNPTEYAYSLFNPQHAEYARVHETYTMKHNKTPYVYTDDRLTYDTPEKCKLYGFVYVDENGNGILDERVRSHVAGATVTVKDQAGEEVLSVVTGLNGYYELPATAGAYTVTVALPDGLTAETTEYTVTVSDTSDFVACNVAAQKESK